MNEKFLPVKCKLCNKTLSIFIGIEYKYEDEESKTFIIADEPCSDCKRILYDHGWKLMEQDGVHYFVNLNILPYLFSRKEVEQIADQPYIVSKLKR